MILSISLTVLLIQLFAILSMLLFKSYVKKPQTKELFKHTIYGLVYSVLFNFFVTGIITIWLPQKFF